VNEWAETTLSAREQRYTQSGYESLTVGLAAGRVWAWAGGGGAGGVVDCAGGDASDVASSGVMESGAADVSLSEADSALGSGLGAGSVVGAS
jgi:hypothetical protein